MPDPLRAQIATALAGPLSGDEFERCAVRLLKPFHPSLLPVAGGNDAGLDGSGVDAMGEFGLVATVRDDALANLRTNLQSHLAAGGQIRRVIFATSRVLSGRRQVNLGLGARKLGFELIHVYDGAQLAELLYRDPECQRDLLGLAGGVGALSSYPVSRRATMRVELLGREDLVRQLEIANGDIVIVGKPGIGKTAVVQDLVDQGWGLFDVGHSQSELADAIRAMGPPRVVVEDAHFSVQRLVDLRHVREEMQRPFGVVATTWPGSRTEVSSALPGALIVEVEELTRAEILALIQNLGVSGPRELQREIVNQALGRPGLATTLAMAALNGGLHDVATGELLFEDIAEWCRTTLGANSHQLLGVIALSGDHGVRVEQCAQCFSISPLEISQQLKALASGGILDETFHFGQRARYLRVQPETLRYLLVKAIFGGTASPDWRLIVQHFDSPAQALIPLVGALLRGASFTRQDLKELLVDDAGVREVQAFASLGLPEARAALEKYPDRKLDIALVALQVDFLFALEALMELGIGDSRAQHSYPNHPIRRISEFLRSPSVAIERREEAIRFASQWLEAGGDLTVGLEVLAAAVHPAVSDIFSDPGAGNTVTLVQGIYPPDLLTRIGQLWDQVLDAVDGREFPTYQPLLSVLHFWVFPNVAQFAGAVDDERRDVARAVSVHVIQRWGASLRDDPGLQSALNDLARRGRLDLSPVNVASDFDVLFPDRDVGEDVSPDASDFMQRVKEHEAAMLDRVKQLAAQWIGSEPAALAERISFAERQASQIGRSWPRFTPQLLEHLAADYSDVPGLLQELDAREVAPDVVAPLLLHVVRNRGAGWGDAVRRHLEDPRTRFVTVHLCLTEPVGDDLQAAAARLMNGGYRNLIEMLAIRKELEEPAIRLLLTHSDSEVAKDSAVAVWRDRPDSLSAETLALCRQTLVHSDGDTSDYWLWHLLKLDPSLLEDWTREWISRNTTERGSFLPHEAIDSISGAPLVTRLRLLGSIPESVRNFFLGDLISALVGQDDEAIRLIFFRPSLADYGRNALAGFPDDSWGRKALIAMRAGMTPPEIAGACIAGMSSWGGTESEHWDQYVQAFERLGEDPELESIAAAGVEGFTRMRDEARARERRDAVFGRDRGDG